MNSSLIKIGKSEISGQKKETVNARELHQFIESKSKFSDWIKNRIEKYGFSENEDYLSISKNLENGGRTIEYYITLDMAKELSMIENNTKGREIRKYFIDCEKKVKNIEVKNMLKIKPRNQSQSPEIYYEDSENEVVFDNNTFFVKCKKQIYYWFDKNDVLMFVPANAIEYTGLYLLKMHSGFIMRHLYQNGIYTRIIGASFYCSPINTVEVENLSDYGLEIVGIYKGLLRA